nr:MAG TPA: hypothetical protein [Caudoviricetes sp.]
MGKSRKIYSDKRPVPHALRPREHYVKKNGVWKAKMSFETEASANNWVAMHSSLRLAWRVYECSVCHKYHLSSIRKGEEDE